MEVKKVKPVTVKKQQKRTYWMFLILILSALFPLEYIRQSMEYQTADISSSFFYPMFGFVSCLIIVAVSKLLGLWLKYPEHYYKKDK